MMSENDDIYIAENILPKQLGLLHPYKCTSQKLGSLWIQAVVAGTEAVSFKRPDLKIKLICLPKQRDNAMEPFPPDDIDTTKEEDHIVKLLWEAETHDF